MLGLTAVVLAVLLWWLRRAALGREENSQYRQEHGSSPSSTSSSQHPHSGSVTRPATSSKPCGTIGTVTPTPAPISDAVRSTAVRPDRSESELDGPGSDSRALDPRLAEAVDVARAAAEEEAAATDDPVGTPAPALRAPDVGAVGEHAGVEPESEGGATHYFESNFRGYVGWRWAVTVASAGPDMPVTVSEVVLLPGPDALTAPAWVPWSDRVRPGDLGAGDLMPSDADDPRLAPVELPGDDPVMEELAHDTGLGRDRVLSRQGRLEAAERWQAGDFGPDSETARLAPAACGTCGFFLPLAGSMRAAFGVCANSIAPADGRVVHVEFGCGAHSEAEVDTSSTVPVAEVVYDDTTLDYESRD